MKRESMDGDGELEAGVTFNSSSPPLHVGSHGLESFFIRKLSSGQQSDSRSDNLRQKTNPELEVAE